MKIGEKLKKLRTEKGYSLEFVARSIGTSFMTVRNWEVGKSNPRSTALKKISDFYGVTVEYLLED